MDERLFINSAVLLGISSWSGLYRGLAFGRTIPYKVAVRGPDAREVYGMTPRKLTFATWFAVAALAGSALAMADPGSELQSRYYLSTCAVPVRLIETWGPCSHAVKAPIDPKTGLPIR